METKSQVFSDLLQAFEHAKCAAEQAANRDANKPEFRAELKRWHELFCSRFYTAPLAEVCITEAMREKWRQGEMQAAEEMRASIMAARPGREENTRRILAESPDQLIQMHCNLEEDYVRVCADLAQANGWITVLCGLASKHVPDWIREQVEIVLLQLTGEVISEAVASNPNGEEVRSMYTVKVQVTDETGHEVFAAEAAASKADVIVEGAVTPGLAPVGRFLAEVASR